MKQTAVEFLESKILGDEKFSLSKWLKQAKEMEKQQLLISSNISAKEAYKAGQLTMSCGCYEISDATTYEEWLYEQFKLEEDND